jgi:hypothetical protein
MDAPDKVSAADRVIGDASGIISLSGSVNARVLALIATLLALARLLISARREALGSKIVVLFKIEIHAHRYQPIDQCDGVAAFPLRACAPARL